MAATKKQPQIRARSRTIAERQASKQAIKLDSFLFDDFRKSSLHTMIIFMIISNAQWHVVLACLLCCRL